MINYVKYTYFDRNWNILLLKIKIYAYSYYEIAYNTGEFYKDRLQVQKNNTTEFLLSNFLPVALGGRFAIFANFTI